MSCLTLRTLAALATVGAAAALEVTVSPQVTHKINPLFSGCHSDTGYTHQARGFYSQMIYGESFEPAPTNGSEWPNLIVDDPSTSFYITLNDSFSYHGNVSLEIVYMSSGQRGNRLRGAAGPLVGLANRGIGNEGLYFEQYHKYDGYLFAYSEKMTIVTVALRDFFNQNKTLASQKLKHPGGGWVQLEFGMNTTAATTCIDGSDSPDVDCGNLGPQPGHICIQCGGEFVVGLTSPGKVFIDYVLLQPGSWARLNHLPVLKTGASLLTEMGIKALRQGGTFTKFGYYFWKDWRGPEYDRPSTGSVWKNSLISGWGPFEMIDMCTALGIEPIITLTALVQSDPEACCTADDMADFVEYIGGDNSTHWGSIRIADGHPEPYVVKYIELGNEQYNYRFLDQVAAMEQRAKDINLPYDLYYIFPQTTDINSTDARKALEMGLPVDRIAVDIHIGAGGGIESAGNDFKAKNWFFNSAVNLETNAGTHDMKRALQEAADLNEWFSNPNERFLIRTASFCTERSGHYDNFDQGLSFFLPNMTWLQPPGHVHAMIARNPAPYALNISVTSYNNDSISAQLSLTGDKVILKYVNLDTSIKLLSVNLPEFTITGQITVSQLAAEEETLANTPADPNMIQPVTISEGAAQTEDSFELTVPQFSYSIISVPVSY